MICFKYLWEFQFKVLEKVTVPPEVSLRIKSLTEVLLSNLSIMDDSQGPLTYNMRPMGKLFSLCLGTSLC